MTGYEIIKGNVEFTKPERIGIRFNRIGNVSDVFRIFVQKPRKLRDDEHVNMLKKPRPIPGKIDEWGCFWDSSDSSGVDMGQVTESPIKEWEDFEDYKMPDPHAEGRFDNLEEALKEAEEKGLYVQLNSPHCIFERMHFLRGFENTLVDTMIDKENIEILADKLMEYQIGIIEEAYKHGKGRIHCYDTTDDWGSQQGLLIPPPIFREVFKPRYKKIVEAAHKAGMHVRFHTDGMITEILQDFIDIGIDILNIHQPRLVDIDEVSKIARGKICFEAAVDIQATLPTGDKDLIKAEVQELVEKWATPEGGLIGVEYGYLSAIGTTKESMEYALECFMELGKLKNE
ncbi:hypothetical protein SH2C18_00720 [Clostridium sediminicola]|uniref:uroporphyrinogen decarboxylase family protein n=1 Tax=Clostridium sediminicola TaxID=3114879 RepID=UPI0031F23025